MSPTKCSSCRFRSGSKAELGVDYRVDVHNVKNSAEAKAIACTLNAERRQLSEKQRRSITIDLRKKGHSTRAIAGALGVGKDTVRRDLKTGGAHAPPEARTTGRDGKSYPATRPPSDNGEAANARAEAASRYEFMHGRDWRDRAAIEAAM